MHCSVIEHGYDVIEFSNCSTEERGVSHYDVISYHCVSKLAYFVEHDIGYQQSKFQCSRMSGSNFMEGGGTPPQC